MLQSKFPLDRSISVPPFPFRSVSSFLLNDHFPKFPSATSLISSDEDGDRFEFPAISRSTIATATGLIGSPIAGSIDRRADANKLVTYKKKLASRRSLRRIGAPDLPGTFDCIILQIVPLTRTVTRTHASYSQDSPRKINI